MENILENKAKFFAQYWEQRFVDWKGNKTGLQRVSPGRLENSDYWLELKSIETISDEDLLKIAGLLPWRSSLSESAVIAQTKEILQPKQFQTNLYREMWSDVIDKVRELGYAHKWNGVTVEKQIEFGWIKIKID